ncbi:hypothetical protein BJV78DRAFT_1223327 [Lactifluus subvellereus]|nr:hypothetical protein BJV78DRAFT_1223327 [Lactifluus subvellereus]
MFSFFSRKQQQPAAESSNLESDVIAVASVPQQLRTPSPSEAAFNGLGSAARITMASPETSTSIQELSPTPEALHTLITSIPPKTLHTYVLSHIAAAPSDTLVALSSFFATLAPPPVLHCVRCHDDYTEVENNDRSCRVPHDDDSADVEWVGRTRCGSDYETYYGCCGQTVEGEGDLGPPNGWCYEGMHTTDTKRARFRADSTPAEDMLTSCLELNCHNVRARLPRASASTSGRNKRARPSLGDGDAADEDDGSSEGTADTGIAEIARGVGALGQKGKAGKGKARAEPKAAAAPATSRMPAPTRAVAHKRTRAVARKPARAPARVRMETPRAQESDAESSKAGSPGAPAPAAAPPTSSSRKRRSDAVSRSTAAPPPRTNKPAAPPDSPKRGRKPRSVAKMDSVEIVVRSRSPTRSRVRGGGADTADERAPTDGEGKVRKRRKITRAGAGAAAS